MIYLGSHIDTKHIDGIEIPGANDSGSSTAALLELARVISTRDTEFTYRFAFFDGEESIEEDMNETDGLYGSKFHVRNLEQNKEVPNIRAMILLDMMGDRDLAVNRDYNSSQDLWRLFASCCLIQFAGINIPGAASQVVYGHLHRHKTFQDSIVTNLSDDLLVDMAAVGVD